VTDPYVADLAMAEVMAAQRRIRSMRRAVTLPVQLLGASLLLGSLGAVLVGRDHLLPVMGPALLLVLLVSARHYRQEGVRTGQWLPVWPWVVVLLPTIVISATLSRFGVTHDRPLLTDAGPMAAMALATGVVGCWLRAGRLVVVTALMLLTTVVTNMAWSGDLAIAVQMAAYSAFLVTATRGGTV
jgi:hypothetical protein